MKQLIFLLLICSTTTAGFTQNRPSRELIKSANDAFQLLKQLVVMGGGTGEDLFILFRKTNKTIVENAKLDTSAFKLGSPIFLSLIRLDSLQQYNAEKPVQNLLLRIHKVIFPVLDLKDDRLTTLAMDSTEGHWRTTYGEDKEIIQMGIRQFLERRGPSDLYKQPAFNKYFIGEIRSGHLLLTPLESDSRYGFVQGESGVAEKILGKMAQDARGYKDAPN